MSLFSNQLRVLPDDLPARFRSAEAETDPETPSAGVDFEALAALEADDLYGILIDAEDAEAVAEAFPADESTEADRPALFSHTSAFPSKLDLRDPETGCVLTQVNFGSVPYDATFLDLRAGMSATVWS